MNGLKTELKSLFGSMKFEEKNVGEIYIETAEDDFLRLITVLAEKKFVLIDLFAVENVESTKDLVLWYVFEKRGYSDVLILWRKAGIKTTSIAMTFHSACWYEREITDGFGIVFEGSYDQRRLFLHEIYPKDFHPLRKSFVNKPMKMHELTPKTEEYKFKEMHGEGVYQIPVGPVHAGIIEPGHFRFSVIGETIFNLEVRMFWKHRGIEKLAENKMPQKVIKLAEAISGDETIANALAYCLAVEKICLIKIPPRAHYLRTLFAEMERIYALLGDLAGMIIDVAYPAGASPFFILREEMLRWNERLSKSRFLKNALQIGGVRIDVSNEILKDLAQYLHGFSKRLKLAVDQSLRFPSVFDRLETTGVIKKELVESLNLSGPLARASGTAADVRINHPYSLYSTIVPHNFVLEQGDVLARFRVKTATIEDSIMMIHKIIREMPSGGITVTCTIKDGFALSLVESARGQNVHFIYIKQGVISRYKVRTASFCSWQVMEHAVLGNIVPDFPLINKSMNISYAGTDL